MNVRFGTDGIRGPASAHPITEAVGSRVGAAARRLSADGVVVVVRDPRPSGGALADAVMRGVVAAGGRVLDGGIGPSSMVGCALHAGLAGAGVMVTASHNPAGDNGFKVFGAGGKKLTPEECALVEGWIEEEPSGTERGSREDAAAAIRANWESAMEAALPDLSALAGKRLVLDAANGAATAVLPWFRECVPGEWHVVGEGDGGVNERCGSEHLESLQAAVVGLDGGFAVDGDADRCRLVDEHGEVVHGDAVPWLFGTQGVGSLAVTVMSSLALERSLPGVRIVRTPVGDRHLALAMAAEDIPLGSEESGHVLFDNFPAGDGILTGLRTLAALFERAPSVSEALHGFEPLPRVLSKVRVAARPPLAEVEPLQALLASEESVLGPFGRVFLRYSGTEPVLRILVEGPEESLVREVEARVRAAATQLIA